MADEGLLGVPMSFGIGDTLLGSLGAGLAQASPKMISPYASTGTALGIGLGSVLLQSLLGYQARQQAADRTIELNKLSTPLLGMQTAQERSDYISGLGDVDTQVLGRLSSLSGALGTRAIEQQQALDLAKRKAELGYEMELSPMAQELQAQKQQRELELIKARNAAFALRSGTPLEVTPLTKEEIELQKSKEAWANVPAEQRKKMTGAKGQAQLLRNLAQKFRALDMYAPALQTNMQIPDSEANLALSQMKTLVPSTVKTLGESGNLSEGDQKRILEATLGSWTSGSQSVANRLTQLADMIDMMIGTQAEQYIAAGEEGLRALIPSKEKLKPKDADTQKYLKIYNNPPSEKHRELAKQILIKRGVL